MKAMSLKEVNKRCKEIEKSLYKTLSEYMWLVNISAGRIIISDLNSKSDFRYTKKNGWGKAQPQVEKILSDIFKTKVVLDFYNSDMWAKHKAIVHGIIIN